MATGRFLSELFLRLINKKSPAIAVMRSPGVGVTILCAVLSTPTTIFHGTVSASLATNDTTYFQTRQLSGQQYGLDYNLQNNFTSVGTFASRPRILFDWNSPSAFEEKPKIQKSNINGFSEEESTKMNETNVKEDNKSVETERVENNVWWPWKNYDDWLNGRGLKAEQPKKKEDNKTDKTRKNRNKKKKNKKKKKNGKNERRRKKPKTEKKRPEENVANTVKVTDSNNYRPAIDNGFNDNEITKKESIPKIRYSASPIDIIMRNRSLVPALVKYTSRNYTYDVNECLTNNGGCEGLCINTPGSYRCHCPPGFMVADTKCEDVDECLLRNGHGPCQGSCSNTWGGYRCSCRGVPGTRLSGDGHTCDDVDECRDGTAGCTHQCINTVGSAFCVCPDGLRLDDDWRTCVDVDECADPELQQPADRCTELGLTCLNTHGSYKCV